MKDTALLVEGLHGLPEDDTELIRLGLLPPYSGEAPKTEREDLAITLALGALERFMAGLGLAARLDRSAIHVFGEVDFAARWGLGRRAFTQFGHVYLTRHFLFLHFLQDLTHEIVHAAALKAAVAPSRGPDKAVTYVRSGFSPLDGRTDTTRWRFVGFNEGVTESIAGELRRSLVAAIGGLLDDDMVRVFGGERLYLPFVLLVDGIVAALAPEESEAAVRRALYADYFTRSFAFMKMLARTLPGSVTVLASVEDAGDALVAAQRLGLDRTAGIIRRLLSRRRRR